MNKKEKEILTAIVKDPRGLLSPSDFINGLAKNNRRSVENLVIGGYVAEVQEHKTNLLGDKVINNVYNFYRATEKGVARISPFHRRWWFSLKNQTALWVGISSIVIGIVGLVISVLVFQHSIKTSRAVNRPYLNADPSKMQVQLRTQHSNPQVASAMEAYDPVDFNNSFSFTITNIGKLPAKYHIDLNSFQPRITGIKKILMPVHNDDIIFPNQTIELIYDIQGTYDPKNTSSIKEVIDNWKKPSQIKIQYSNPEDKKWQFETLINQEAVERNCDLIPTPGQQCVPADWVVRFIK